MKIKQIDMLKQLLKIETGNRESDIPAGKKYVFKLFVTGLLPNSARAVVNIRAICETYLKNRYELEVIDIYQQPSAALQQDIIAVPLLIKKFPLPEVRLLGDLSDTAVILKELYLI